MTNPQQEDTSEPDRELAFDQFRQELEQEMERAIDRHELKMSGIGILTLVIFLAVIGLVIVF